ncbi:MULTISPECIES: conjugal transfer relaxosome DNA-binding protein TraM [Yersinia]|uniref:conjugal transfer relaxosome DNA-binding protein TraM n=1 Tax=Yersinia TaxID=629 RepID=UPI0005E043D2|nr:MULTISPECIES: conjugal transfer relaxosome DNA-binding protein TraM [Yersinia]MBW5835465.1 relaxosome protein TraM [Yersinia enterocolitica]CNL74240.1 conjugal transfer protein TraM [Yersinia enterocolitica]HEN3645033.1 relaxosome protein TraM [Yersinia enterocolitica]
MPRIQTFVSNDIEQEIVDIINIKRSEGASKDEANVSNTTSMLIELGIRVYKLQRQKSEGGFSQIEFNKVMLENMMKTSFICQKLLGINSFNSEIQAMPKFQYKEMATQIKSDVDSVMVNFFPSEDEKD